MRLNSMRTWYSYQLTLYVKAVEINVTHYIHWNSLRHFASIFHVLTVPLTQECNKYMHCNTQLYIGSSSCLFAESTTKPH